MAHVSQVVLFNINCSISVVVFFFSLFCCVLFARHAVWQARNACRLDVLGARAAEIRQGSLGPAGMQLQGEEVAQEQEKGAYSSHFKWVS
jgi:hypothetical protein